MSYSIPVITVYPESLARGETQDLNTAVAGTDQSKQRQRQSKYLDNLWGTGMSFGFGQRETWDRVVIFNKVWSNCGLADRCNL